MTRRDRFDRSLLPDHPDLTFERDLWQRGAKIVAGVDEAGRGALAGPVAAGAVVLSPEAVDIENSLKKVRDSKEMTPGERDFWAGAIKEEALAWGVGFASNTEIDDMGILPATCLAASRALVQLAMRVEHILVDYITLPDETSPQTALVRGDARSLSIACASVLAKTSRDALLVQMDEAFPGYDFTRNKGYATRAHRLAIGKLGPCPQHRHTFAPVKDYYSLFPPNHAQES